jgi:oligogalacturonide transport system substrate-binding protein
MRRRAALAALGSSALAGAPAVHAQAGRVLRFSWWGGAARHEATLKALALFERRNPGLKVKAEYMGFNGYLERLTTQIAGGSEPDVMQINWAWLAMFSRKGKGFTDLTPYQPLLAVDQFPPEDLQMGRVAERLNAVPVGFTARVLLWNETTFGKAGLKPPRSWDELFAAGPIFKQRLGEDHYPLDGELYDMILLAQAWVQQKHGLAFIDPASQSVAMSPSMALEWVRIYQRLVGDHVCTPLRLRASLGGAEKPTEQQNDWVQGRWAGNYTWDSVIALRGSTLKGDQRLTLGEFPRLPGTQNSGMFGRPTLMYAVGRNSKQAELAARLIAFLTTDTEAASLLGRTRGIPAARNAMDLLVRERKIPPLELSAHQQILAQKQAGAIPLPSPLFEHARMQKFMREVFETIAYGKTTDVQAAHRLVDEGNSLLRRIR